jgi:hypothetical protein
MIFREDAVRHYAQGREAAVLPRFVSPPTFRCLWAMLALLLAGGVVAWFAVVASLRPTADALRVRPATEKAAHSSQRFALGEDDASPSTTSCRLAQPSAKPGTRPSAAREGCAPSAGSEATRSGYVD